MLLLCLLLPFAILLALLGMERVERWLVSDAAVRAPDAVAAGAAREPAAASRRQ